MTSGVQPPATAMPTPTPPAPTVPSTPVVTPLTEEAPLAAVTETPLTTPASSSPAAPSPIIKAVETLPGAPQNTFITDMQRVKPTAPVETPAETVVQPAFAQELPLPTPPVVPDPLPLEIIENTAPAAVPAPPAEIPSAETAVQAPSPASQPAAPATNEPLEAKLQEAIDSSLAEIGAVLPETPAKDDSSAAS